MIRDAIDEEMNKDPMMWLSGEFSVSDRRILITRCVANAWKQFHQCRQHNIIKTFQNLGLSLPIDGSQDHCLHIKDISAEDLIIGDWHQEEEQGFLYLGNADQDVAAYYTPFE